MCLCLSALLLVAARGSARCSSGWASWDQRVVRNSTLRSHQICFDLVLLFPVCPPAGFLTGPLRRAEIRERRPRNIRGVTVMLLGVNRKKQLLFRRLFSRLPESWTHSTGEWRACTPQPSFSSALKFNISSIERSDWTKLRTTTSSNRIGSSEAFIYWMCRFFI